MDADVPKNDESIRNMKLYLSCIVAIMFAMISMEAIADTPVGPYVLEGTEVHNIPSKILRRDCEVFVSLPDSCATGKKSYPALFVMTLTTYFQFFEASTAASVTMENGWKNSSLLRFRKPKAIHRR